MLIKTSNITEDNIKFVRALAKSFGFDEMVSEEKIKGVALYEGRYWNERTLLVNWCRGCGVDLKCKSVSLSEFTQSLIEMKKSKNPLTF